MITFSTAEGPQPPRTNAQIQTDVDALNTQLAGASAIVRVRLVPVTILKRVSVAANKVDDFDALTDDQKRSYMVALAARKKGDPMPAITARIINEEEPGP